VVPPPPVEFLPELYGADPAQLLQSIRNACVNRPDTTDAGRAQSGTARTGARADRQRLRPRHAMPLAGNLPTSGLAVFEFDGNDWNDVAFRRGRLVGFVSPKLPEADFRRLRHMRVNSARPRWG